MSRRDIIADQCDQAGCSTELRKKHYKQFLRGWEPHPPIQFVSWWLPDSRDSISGADVGGHPEARRQWARKDAHGFAHRWYGITAESAYNAAFYRAEYEAWLSAGSPARVQPFMSLAAPLVRQKKFWDDLKSTIARIGKPMPKTNPVEIGLDAERSQVDERDQF